MLTISQSQLTEDREPTLRFSLRNESAGSLKLSVDLSGNDFLEIKDPVVVLPIIRGQKATRSVKVTPKGFGKFDLVVNTEAIVDGVELETKKTFRVEVKENPTSPELTSTQATS